MIATNMTKANITIAVCLLVSGCRTQAPILATESLEKNFPGSIQWVKEEKHEVRFCPDNTCDVFSTKNNISDESMAAYVVLYAYFFSDYFVLKEWRDLKSTQQQAETVQLLLRSELPDLTCSASNCAREILISMGERKGISIYRGRFDEDNFIKEPVNLAAAEMKNGR